MSESVAIEQLELLKKGDQRTFESLFRQFYQALCFYGFKYLSEQEQVEEVVQSVFTTIWEKREQLKIETSFKAYLYRSVRNSCLNMLKHEKVKQEYVSDYQAAGQQDQSIYSEEAQDPDLAQHIAEAIDKLPPERKAIFKMSKLEGLKYKEIAEKQGISIKTVENQMGKALQFLREELKDYAFLILFSAVEIIKSLIGGWG